jgi:hypothetical protein
MELPFTLSKPEKLKESMDATTTSFSFDVNLSISSCRRYLTGPKRMVWRHSIGVDLLNKLNTYAWFCK